MAICWDITKWELNINLVSSVTVSLIDLCLLEKSDLAMTNPIFARITSLSPGLKSVRAFYFVQLLSASSYLLNWMLAISLEGMMLKLKLQYFGHLMRRADSLEKTLMLGGIGSDRGWDGWMAYWLDGRESEWTPGVGDGQGGLACCDTWGRKDWATELNWIVNHWIKPVKSLTFTQWIFKNTAFIILSCSHPLAV